MKEEMSLHEWIYNYIEEAIRFGIFRQGEKLPTISQFAERFQVSRRPVIHAFKLLEEHHYIEMSRGRHSHWDLTKRSVERTAFSFFWKENMQYRICVRYAIFCFLICLPRLCVCLKRNNMPQFIKVLIRCRVSVQSWRLWKRSSLYLEIRWFAVFIWRSQYLEDCLFMKK